MPPQTFHINPEAAAYDVAIADYLSSDPSIQNVCIGAVIRSGPYILLVQRAEHDFGGLLWEVPGGACEGDKDKTILHAVAREVWEETGLHVRSVQGLVDYEEKFQDISGEKHGTYVWRKLTFKVEVEEGYGLEPSETRSVIGQAVKLDPNEHCDWGWATKELVGKGQWDTEKGEMGFMDLQKQVILHDFKTSPGTSSED